MGLKTRLLWGMSLLLVAAAGCGDDGGTATDAGASRDASQQDATAAGGCDRFEFVAAGGACMDCSFTCQCAEWPRSIAACTADGCLVEGNCDAICAGELGDALECTETYTVRAGDPDAGTDAGTACSTQGITAPIESVVQDLASSGFAIAGGSVYYYDAGERGIVRSAADGSGTPAPMWTTEYAVHQLAVGDQRALWVDNKRVRVALLAGGEPATLYDSGTVSPAAHALAVAGDDFGFHTSGNALYFLPAGADTAESVAGANTTGLGLAGGFFVVKELGTLAAISAVDGSETPLANARGGFSVADGRVYYRAGQAREIRSVDVSTAPTEQVIAPLPEALHEEDVDLIASDGSSVYVGARCAPLYRIGIADGSVTKLATLDDAANLQVDATHVYWVALEGNRYQIYRLPK